MIASISILFKKESHAYTIQAAFPFFSRIPQQTGKLYGQFPYIRKRFCRCRILHSFGRMFEFLCFIPIYNTDKIIFLLNSFRVVKQKPNSMPRREIGCRLSLWGYAPHAQTDNKLHALWGYAPHTRGYFLMKRKYPKIHQKPAGFWISSGKGALPPLDSPMNTLHKRGSVTACGYCGGNFPQGICKGKPLTHAFTDFSRERKVSASVGGMSPQN